MKISPLAPGSLSAASWLNDSKTSAWRHHGRTEHVTKPTQGPAAHRAALEQVLAGQDMVREDQLRFNDDVIDADGHAAGLAALFVGLAQAW